MSKVITLGIRILAWVVYLALTAALLLSLPLALGRHPVVVLSGSMEPAYPVGSLVYYRHADFSEIAVGDVITFRIGGKRLATHRVAEKDEENRCFITRGDANAAPDAEPVAWERVVGKTSPFSLPGLGYFLRVLLRWYVVVGMGLILLLNALVVPREGGAGARPTHAARRRVRAPTAAEYFRDF